MRRFGVLLAAAAALASCPVSADDWIRARLADNWLLHEGVFDLDGKRQVVIIGYPGGSPGSAVVAAIPAEGEISWFDYQFQCDQRTGKALNAWTSDRLGENRLGNGSGADYAPVPPGTLTEDLFTFACTGARERWTPVEGDVLAAAERALAAAE